MTLAVAPGDWVRNTVSSGGYPALAGLILVENLFPPIPSELILPLAGFYVGEGEMLFALAVLAAALRSLSGAPGLADARPAAVRDRALRRAPGGPALRQGPARPRARSRQGRRLV